MDSIERNVKPKLSIIVPVYNVEKYLQDCIDSLLNQTLKEIEIIFVNDASPDHSLDILKKNQKLYPDKIKIIDSKENLKQGGARNLGIREAQGEYIAFVDSDDFVAPTAFEQMYMRIVEREADVCFMDYTEIPESISYSNVFKEKSFTDFKGNGWIEKHKELESVTLSEEEIMEKADLTVAGLGGVWGSVWSKKLILDHSLLFPEHLAYEDNYWCWLTKCYVHKYTFIDEIGYFYRTISQSTSRARNSLRHYDRIEINRRLITEATNRGLFPKYKEVFEYISIFTCFSTYFILMHKFDKPPRELIRKIPKDCLGQFPKWKSNSFYRKEYTKLRRIKYAIIYKFPIIMLYVHPIYEKIRKKIQERK